jgi:D-sedoheptulose 7-phosphate isomerase
MEMTVSGRFESSLYLSETFLKSVDAATEAMVKSLKNDGGIYSCGNGGSMCDAMHFAEELSGRYRDNRPA